MNCFKLNSYSIFLKILFFIALIITIFVNAAKGQSSTLDIKLHNPDPVQYCNKPEKVAEFLTIEGNPNIVGMKISFSGGYIASEDELVYTGSLQKSWYPVSGTLLLTGISTTTVHEYVDAIKTITYKNNSSTPTLGVRKITISLSDVDYLDYTEHFYRFVSKPNIKWTDAEAEAKSDAMKYYGLRGYLATITSQVENDFIRTKTTGVGWIGATDAAVEGDWRWVTGPEGQEDGGQGRLFWKGTGYQAKSDPANYGPVNGAYFNWNRWDVPYSSSTASSTWEPNQSGNEDYAHITVFQNEPNNSFKWNDLPDAGGTYDYASKGYLIEFGGSKDDPNVNVMATLDLQVNTMLFKNDPITAICEGTSVTLNQEDKNVIPATYSWNPTQTLSDATIANPVATPTTVPTTTYTVTGMRGICKETATYTIPVNPKPVSLLKAEENICKGTTITLDPGVYQSYSWDGGAITQTITVGDAGEYTVKLTSDKGCTASSTSKVVVHDFPTVDLSKLQTLICYDTQATTVANITTNSAEGYSLKPVGNSATILGLNVSVPDTGKYQFVYKANHLYCPVEKNIELAFYKIPKFKIDIDTSACHGYNIDATCIGISDVTHADFTWIFGGDTIINGIGRYKEKISLGVNKSIRDLVLNVERDGCSGKFTINDIRVIPTLSLFVKDSILCLPDTFEFSAANTETGVTYDWDFGDGITGTGVDASHKYTKYGKYDIQLKVTTDKNCSNTSLNKDMVFAAPIPDVAFSLSPDSCLNLGLNQISYTGLIGTDKDSYNWILKNFDQSEIITNPGVTKGPFGFNLKTKPLTKLWLQVTSEFGCKSLIDSIQLKRKPDFSISSDATAGCIPFAPNLSGIKNVNDLTDIIDFTWDFGDGATGTGSPLSHTYNKPDTIYSVTLTGKSSVTQCSNVLTKTGFLKTYPQPKAAFSMDNAVVYSDKPDVKFTDLSKGVTSWLWNFGDGKTSELQNPTYHFVKVGHQTILLEVTNSDQCTDTISQKLLVAFDRLFPPNGFSPNAPNKIDREFLLNSDGVSTEGYHLTVLSRWNDLIFEAKNEIKGWDGRMNNGTLAPAGVYVWILNYTDFLGRRHQQTGTVTLVY